jgi:hypothetical protein
MSVEPQPGLATLAEGSSTPDSAGAGSSKRKRLDQGNMANGPANDQPISLANPSNYPRKRVSIACEVCRVRKTRCDAVKPSCSFCSQLGVECTYRKPTLGNRSVPSDRPCPTPACRPQEAAPELRPSPPRLLSLPIFPDGMARETVLAMTRGLVTDLLVDIDIPIQSFPPQTSLTVRV